MRCGILEEFIIGFFGHFLDGCVLSGLHSQPLIRSVKQVHRTSYNNHRTIDIWAEGMPRVTSVHSSGHRPPLQSFQNSSGTRNVSTEFSRLSLAMMLLFFTSKVTPRGIWKIPFGPPIVHNGCPSLLLLA